MNYNRPIVPWLGGKWRIAPWVISHFPEHVCYAEPFGGAASVLLRKPPSCNEIYNDLDGRLVNLFRVLQSQGMCMELAELIRQTPYARAEHDLAEEPSADPIESARRFLVLSHTSFRSLGCSKENAAFNSFPRDRHNPARGFSLIHSQLSSIGNRLRNVIIENLDALDFISRCDSRTTLIYADPPYANESRPAKSNDGADGPAACYRHELADEYHAALSRALHETPAMVAISGYDCDLYRDLYSGWKMTARKNINLHCDSRTECLWVNAACAEGKLQRRFLAM